jgi:hypothetical protein
LTEVGAIHDVLRGMRLKPFLFDQRQQCRAGTLSRPLDAPVLFPATFLTGLSGITVFRLPNSPTRNLRQQTFSPRLCWLLSAFMFRTEHFFSIEHRGKSVSENMKS